MSLTQISKKQSKNDKHKFLEVILGICLLSMVGCSKTSDTTYELIDPVSTASANETSSEYSDFYHTKIELANDAKLYDSSQDEIGTVFQGTYLDIDEGSGEYLEVSHTNYFVKGEDVQVSNRWFQNTNHLLKQAKAITTKDSYTLYDEKDVAQVTFEQSDTYDVYVLATEAYPTYGVLFQNKIYYIHSSDVVSTNDTDTIIPSTSTSIPVLMYHFFYSEENGETRQDGNYVEVNELDEQLSSITNEGFTALTMREVLYFMQGRAIIPEKSLAITIDDGDPSVHTYAYPIFQKYGINATLFLITGWEDSTMSYDFWEMRENGLELQSHGFLTHQGGCSGMGHGGRLLCMDHDEGVEDTKMSLDYVDGGFVYCYPFGDVNDNAKQILKDSGVSMAFTTANGWISPGDDLYELPRVRVHGGDSIESFMNSIR